MKRSFVVNVAGGFVGFVLALLVLSFASNANALSLNHPAVVQAPASIVSAPSTTSISSTFTYQGQLKTGGSPISGLCNMAFRLYDDPAAGSLIGSPNTTTVSINNGFFTAGLNFGNNAFTGSARWLDIRVRCPAGSGSFTTLAPRQAVTAAPYALAPWVTSGSTLYYNSGNVGIGTNSPSAALSVVKSGATEPTAYGVPVGLKVGAPSGTIPFAVRQNTAEASTPGLALFETSDGNLGGFGANVDTFVVSAAASHGLGFNVDNTTRAMTIPGGGNVGVGTIFPAAKLEVKGGGSGITSWDFRVVNSSDQTGLLVFEDGIVQIGKIWTGADASSVHSCYNLVLAYSFAQCSPAAAAYVPMMDHGSGFPETADLVSLFPSEKNPYADERAPFVVGKTTKPCDENLLGFVADPKQGADGERKNAHYLPLALSGNLPAKVTMENGVIKRGDPLTSSSKPGYAMKATQACKIIGYALEDANQDGTIQVFAHLSENAAPAVAALTKQLDETKAANANLAARVNQLEQQNTDLATRLSKLEQNATASSLPSQPESLNMFNLSGMIVIGGVMIVWLQQRKRRGGAA